ALCLPSVTSLYVCRYTHTPPLNYINRDKVYYSVSGREVDMLRHLQPFVSGRPLYVSKYIPAELGKVCNFCFGKGHTRKECKLPSMAPYNIDTNPSASGSAAS